MTDGLCQRTRRGLSVIAREDEESQGIFQWNEDYSYRRLTDGRALKPVTETERISSTVPEKTKSLNCQRG
jgi:hypothetical protein